MARKSAPPPLDADTRICVLYGSEPAVQRLRLDALCAAMKKEHGEVETFTYDGVSAQLAEVFDELRGYSLMQQHKLVIVDAADQFVKRYREPMERYAASPVDHATLVLRGEKWARSKLDKLIAAVGAVVKCEAPSAAEAVTWAIGRAGAAHGARLERTAAQLLVERLGPHLDRIDSEIGRLAALVGEPEGAEGPRGRGAEAAAITIDRTTVQEAAGRSSEDKAWEVQDALLAALGAGPGPAVAKVHELIDLAGHHGILVQMAAGDLFRKLAVGRAMMRDGAAAGQVSRDLKVWPPPRARAFEAALAKLPPGAAERGFDRIIRLDARSKSGFGEPLRNLECFCVELADTVRQESPRARDRRGVFR